MMKNLLLGLLFLGSLSFAQSPANAVQYMNDLSADNDQIMKQTWKYMSAIARGKRAKKIEKLREKLKSEVNGSLARVKKMPPFEGSTALRDSAISLRQMSLDIMTGKTQKLINMEEIADNSYDAMEAYIFFQREINKSLHLKNEMIRAETRKFAEQNNVNLIESESELGKKIEKTSEILWYKDLMYLSFFRCMVYEKAFLLATQDPNSKFDYPAAGLMLVTLADESKQKMDTISDINNDTSLRQATLNALKFFETEADQLVPAYVEYNQTKHAFEQASKTLENTKKKDRTQEMINEYNQWVAKINKASNKVNQLMNTFNNRRAAIYENWSKTADAFVARHAPEE